jgi:hypothetical protein
MTSTTWTAASVRRELPAIGVKIGKKTVTGRISGRLNQFATVSVTNMGTLHSGSQVFADWQVSWDTLAHCLNTGRPVIV